MKSPFLKTVAIAGALAFVWNCSSDTPVAAVTTNGSASEGTYNVTAQSWLWSDGDTDYLISSADYTVTDANGTPVGVFDVTTGAILTLDGQTVIVAGLDLNVLQQIEPTTPAATSSAAEPVATSSADAVLPVQSSATTTPDPVVASSSSSAVVATSSAETQVVSSSSQQDLGSLQVSGSLTQSASQGSAISKVTISGASAEPTRQSWNLYWLEVNYSNGTYTISGTVPEYFQDGEQTEYFQFGNTVVEFKLTVGSGSTTQSSASTTQSSASTAKSSSSTTVKSSSSTTTASSSSTAVSSSSAVTTGCPTIKVKSGGNSGSGFASRYWDCCKPSCSWSENAGSAGNASQCSANGKTKSTDYSAASTCSGGSIATCTSQIPFTVSGCDNIGFAFAAVPSADGGSCGKCYQLTFTGTGKYETKQNHKALLGKSLVIMVTNVGSDVAQGQFDIMIPGGGVGLYNGCSSMGWGDQGKQYGGLLSDCESEVGYSASAAAMLTLRKERLTKKCNSVFSSDSEAKQGCLFLADFMEAAGNPNHTYKEVECPSVLSSKY